MTATKQSGFNVTRWLPAKGMQILLAAALGILAGILDFPMLMSAADGVSQVFINLLKMVSLPIIFLSIVSTASGLDSMESIKILGRRVLKYTLITTLAAALVALAVFVAIDPLQGVVAPAIADTNVNIGQLEVVDQPTGYWGYLLNTIPSSAVQPFVTNNVIGVLFLAICMSMATLTLPKDKKDTLHQLFSSLYAAVMQITTWIVALMPIGIWAFVTLFVHDVRQGLDVSTVALYLICVVGANLVQGFVVLPLFLKLKGLSPIRTFKGMLPALSVAFFAKSSSAALPMAMQCAEGNLGISRQTASFSLPLCTTINMNGCAAFILQTVLFVSMSHGVTYTPVEMLLWVFIATIAAIGNAGVPMGCFFLSSALLVSMNVPLHIMGVILPFYTLVDMLESAINVWSDSCVTAVVDTEMRADELTVFDSAESLEVANA
jgi:Na+/H+-dicarboxylate symporter